REGAIAFSEKYFPATETILTTEDKTADDEAGLKDITVAAQAGSTGLDDANENSKDAEAVTDEEIPISTEALKNGQADAVINDNGVLYHYAANDDGFTGGFDSDTGEHYGIGMKKGNEEMKTAVDETVKEIKDSGEYDKIYEKWFGDAPK